MSENNGLSERELDVLKLVAKGASNKEIANELYISPNTVKVHLRKIFSKIGVTSRTEAALYAVNTGIAPALAEDQNNQPPAEMDAVPAEGAGSGVARRRVIHPVVLAIATIILIVAGIVVINLLDNSRDETAETSPSFAVIPRWHQMAGMPTARSGLAVASVESRLYAIGGEAGDQVLGTVEMYDPESDSWSVLGAKPTPVADVHAVSFGGKIFVPGGRLQSGEVTSILEIYDPRQDQWDQGAELPVPLSAYGLVSHEGKLYSFGGFDGDQYVSQVFRYDPEQDVWDQFASLPEARGYVGVASVNEKIYVLGGFDGERVFDTSYIFSPGLDAGGENLWGTAAPLPDGVYGMGVTTIADVIYVAGGESDRERKSELVAYFQADDEWKLIEGPENRIGYQAGVIAIGEDVFVVGGRNQGQASSRNQRYQAIFTVSVPVIIK